MKFTIEKRRLHAALRLIEKTIDKRSSIPILSNLRIDAHAKTVELRGTDLDLEMSQTVAADVKTKGATCVPAAMLSQIVGKLPQDAEVTFDHDTEKGVVKVRSGRFHSTLHTLPVQDFPALPESVDGFKNRFTLSRAAFDMLFRRPRFAVSSEETRYYLNGIYLHLKEDDRAGQFKLYACATDGHRMAVTKTEVPDGAAGMPGVIVPRPTVDHVLRAVDSIGPDAIGVGVSQTRIQFEIGDVLLTSKLIDGTFPDYQRVVPTGNDKTAKVVTDLLRQATDRVTTISSERGRTVKLSFEADQVKLSVSNPDTGTSEEDVDGEFDGAPLDIGFNSRYLCDILSEVDTDDVSIKLGDGGSPTIFAPFNQDDTLFVLMPMRI
jgi:DNA polymerase III subunit beta